MGRNLTSVLGGQGAAVRIEDTGNPPNSDQFNAAAVLKV